MELCNHTASSHSVTMVNILIQSLSCGKTRLQSHEQYVPCLNTQPQLTSDLGSATSAIMNRTVSTWKDQIQDKVITNGPLKGVVIHMVCYSTAIATLTLKGT